MAELSAAAAKLDHALDPRTAANLAHRVRIMNTYYSNLIEGHNTRQIDIARALAGKFDKGKERRNLRREAAAHVRVQGALDRMAEEQRFRNRLRRILFAGCIESFIVMRQRRCCWCMGTVESFS